jgi:putative hydrolase of the HAD superfamily
MNNSHQNLDLSKFTHLLIDLDDTLYHHTNGAWAMIRQRIHDFMVNVLQFPEERVPELRERLWRQYGTTLRGLQAEYAVDMDAYLDYVHDIPLETMIFPNPKLNQLLDALPQHKIIFTNSHIIHAERVLNLLGIKHHFDCIVDIYAMAPYCKPQVEAFQKVLDLTKSSPEDCLMIDDSPVNLQTAHSLGMGTLSVGLNRYNDSPHIDNILELGTVLNH